jgi:hypothetical protein
MDNTGLGPLSGELSEPLRSDAAQMLTEFGDYEMLEEVGPAVKGSYFARAKEA